MRVGGQKCVNFGPHCCWMTPCSKVNWKKNTLYYQTDAWFYFAMPKYNYDQDIGQNSKKSKNIN